MARPLKLNPAMAEAMCAHAELGLPIGRASALAGIHRCTAMRWLREGASEIDAITDDDDADLSLRGRFAIDFEAARATYLLGLATKWQERIDKQDYNTAKAIQVMLASQSPDEYSERRATRTVDQRVAMQADLTVSRYAEMSVEDLDAERSRISARRAAAQADAGDDWQDAVVKRHAPAGEDIDPGPPSEEKTPEPDNPQSGSQKRKSEIGGFSGDDHGSTENISPTRARPSNAPVVADAESVVAALAPEHDGEADLTRAASPFPPGDEDTQL